MSKTDEERKAWWKTMLKLHGTQKILDMANDFERWNARLLTENAQLRKDLEKAKLEVM